MVPQYDTHNPYKSTVNQFAIYETYDSIDFPFNDDIAKSIEQALVSSRLDYANGILYGVSQLIRNKLQKVQNTGLCSATSLQLY